MIISLTMMVIIEEILFRTGAHGEDSMILLMIAELRARSTIRLKILTELSLQRTKAVMTTKIEDKSTTMLIMRIGLRHEKQDTVLHENDREEVEA